MKGYLLLNVNDKLWKAIKKLAIDQDTTIKGLIIKGFEKQLIEAKETK